MCMSNKMVGLGFPGGSEGKGSAQNAGSPSLIPGSGRSLEKEMATHSGTLAWKIPWTEKPHTVHGVAKNQKTLSDFTFTYALQNDYITSLVNIYHLIYLLTSITSYSHNVFLVMKTSKIYSFSNFQIYSTVWSQSSYCTLHVQNLFSLQLEVCTVENS